MAVDVEKARAACRKWYRNQLSDPEKLARLRERRRRNSRARNIRDREAVNTYAREYARANRSRLSLQIVARRFGVTVEALSAQLEAQSGACAICRRPEGRKRSDGSSYPLSLDHCHVSGEIRGFLCHECNRGLGAFGDEPDRLITASAYVSGGGVFQSL